MIKYAWALTSVALIACGSSSEPLTLDGYGQEAVDRRCQRGVECGFYPDRETCLAVVRQTSIGQAESDIEAGLAEFDPDAADACLDVADACSNAFTPIAEDVERLEACLDVFAGALGDGEVCTADQQCASSLCVPADDCVDACCEGTCQTGQLPFIGNGDDCNPFGGLPCEPGLFCQITITPPDMATAQCAPLVAIDGACIQYDECEAGAFCDRPDDSQPTPGTCQEQADRGQACVPASRWKDDSCSDIRDYCDAETGECEPRPEEGESCAGTTPCLIYAYCSGGTCQTRPVEGEGCNPDDGPFCLGDLFCNESGTCEVFDPGEIEICEGPA